MKKWSVLSKAKKKGIGIFLLGVFILIHLGMYWGGPLHINQALTGTGTYQGTGMKIQLKGAVFENKSGTHFTIRAVVPEPEIFIQTDEKVKIKKLTLRVRNINPDEILLSGLPARGVRKIKNGLKFSVRLEPNRQLHLKLRRPRKEKSSFFAFGDSRGSAAVTNKRGYFFVFSRIIKQVEKRHGLFAIDLGDVVSSGKYYHYRRFKKQLQKIEHTPFFGAIGNHDSFPNGRKYWPVIFGPFYYSFVWQGWHFIILDNADGQMGKEQLDWFEKTLYRLPGGKTFVFMHKPLMDPRPGQNYVMENELERNHLLKLFESYQPRAVFAGHIHGYLHTKRGETEYFITGGGGSRLRVKNGFYHYLRVDIDRDKINFFVIKISNMPTVGWLFYLTINVTAILIILRICFFCNRSGEYFCPPSPPPSGKGGICNLPTGAGQSPE